MEQSRPGNIHICNLIFTAFGTRTSSVPHLGVFLLLYVFAHVWVEMLRVSFIQTVDFPLFLNLHISVHQDELADRLENVISGVKLNSRTSYRTNGCAGLQGPA